MAFPIWTDRKTIGLDHHEMITPLRSLTLQRFPVPAPCPALRFGALALSAAYGRTATLDRAPALLHLGEQLSVLCQLLVTIGNGSPFQLAPAFSFLNDDAAPTLAGRVGAAVTDLYMTALGYVWRDNARSIAPESDPRADFIYSGGPVGSAAVVLAEAHGTFAANTSSASVRLKARSKYTRQIKDYLGIISPHGPVAHGYSVAFGSRPIAAGAFLAVVETAVRTTPGAQPVPLPSSGVRRGIALASHRSNFLLMGAEAVVSAIDFVEGADIAAPAEQVFIRIALQGRSFFIALPGRDDISRLDLLAYFLPIRPKLLGGDSGSFRYGMDEGCARAFLKQLSRLVLSRWGQGGRLEPDQPEYLDLPEVDPIGLDTSFFDTTDDQGIEIVRFRDGLSALQILSNAPVEASLVRWSFGARQE